ncbi:auxilin-like clathrin-binding protein required for normal clathrin function [Scheffersomyces amazonensis]|uniref:auxilin-like clathrin-binding protein required for normal clathrin function n=1 Tax=Scheffersomyces amazonensis TaxID=1078765 RepID=UPI00315D1EBC
MVPPKKDAFADLFQSATSSNNSGTKLNNLSMLERSKLQQSGGNGPSNNSYSNLDILSGSSSRIASPSPSLTPNPRPIPTMSPRINISQTNTPISVATSNSSLASNTPRLSQQVPPSSIDNDPFDIFLKKDTTTTAQSKIVNGNGNGNKPTTNIANDFNGISLLDDDFTDAFEYKPPVKATPPPPPVNPIPERPSSTSKKDEVLAELIDIGFSIDDANESIREMGPELQLCVNYIMNKNSKPNTPKPTKPNAVNSAPALPSRQQYAEDYGGINIGDIGQDWYNKANKFINKSKKTVLKNIEKQMQGGSYGKGDSNSSLPQWMRDQDKYKADAVEKKFEGSEDYGSDEENINQEDIQRFMRLQKEKERERNKARLEKVYNKVTGSKEGSPSSELYPEPKLPPRPTRQSPPSSRSSPISTPRISARTSQSERSASERLAPSRSNGQIGTPSTSTASQSLRRESKPTPNPTPNPTPVPTPKPAPVPEIDLIGISGSSTVSSSLRAATPLNQFQSVDYNTSKTTASEAFRSGDYDKALENYKKCIGALPEKHEKRVIIFSNLANVYKLVGSLKKSIESIDEGLKLIGKDEISNKDLEIESKPIRYWYVKLLITKAETLELLEKYPDSLTTYQELLTLNVNDKKVLDSKNRIDKIVNPQNYISRPSSTVPSKPVVQQKSIPTKQVSPVPPRKQTADKDDIDPILKENIDLQIQDWLKGKNFRELLVSIKDIIPSKINVKAVEKGDVLLNKRVKIQYLKTIAMIHPDKTYVQCKDDIKTQLLCNGVFIHLNKQWETFKAENNL